MFAFEGIEFEVIRCFVAGVGGFNILANPIGIAEMRKDAVFQRGGDEQRTWGDCGEEVVKIHWRVLHMMFESAEARNQRRGAKPAFRFWIRAESGEAATDDADFDPLIKGHRK